jgi:hypothetical protein
MIIVVPARQAAPDVAAIEAVVIVKVADPDDIAVAAAGFPAVKVAPVEVIAVGLKGLALDLQLAAFCLALAAIVALGELLSAAAAFDFAGRAFVPAIAALDLGALALIALAAALAILGGGGRGEGQRGNAGS